MVARFSRLIIIALLCAVPLGAMAQSPQPAAAPTQPLLKAPELDQLVAPIALHPDPLLSEILIASTYPLEVVQADRWAKSNKTLKGDALTAAIAKQSWDDSVKSLVQVPTVLAMMAEQLDWTQKLGDAVLAQQADVMDAIQRLRTRAQGNGKLKSTKEQTVTVKTEDEKQYVVIEPTSPTEIYVPYYEPAVVYGDWPYPDYAPYYFPPPYGYFAGGVLAAGIAFAAAVAIRHAFWGNCDWGRRNINVVSNRSVDINNINRGKMGAQRRSPPRREIQQRRRAAEIRQDRHPGRARRRGRIFAARTARRCSIPIATAQVQVTVPGAGDRARCRRSARDRRLGLPQEPARRPSDRASNQARRRPSGQLSSRRRPAASSAARRRPSGQLSSRRRHSDRASRAATALFQASNRAPGFSTKPIAAAKAWGVAEERRARPVAAAGGGPTSRSSTTSRFSAISTTALASIASAISAATSAYVGVMAQEVQTIMPEAVVRGRDGYLRVFYDKLGLKFQTYDRWIASGARIPTITALIRH